MANISITKMSSKGQVVIPADMRGDIKEGDKLLVIKSGNQIILKKASNMDKQLKEDLEFARRTEKAWKEIDEGRYTSYTEEEFFKKLREWSKR